MNFTKQLRYLEKRQAISKKTNNPYFVASFADEETFTRIEKMVPQEIYDRLPNTIVPSVAVTFKYVPGKFERIDVVNVVI